MKTILKLFGISSITALILTIAAKAIDFKDFKKKHFKKENNEYKHD